jgi:hypothetical protein
MPGNEMSHYVCLNHLHVVCLAFPALQWRPIKAACRFSAQTAQFWLAAQPVQVPAQLSSLFTSKALLHPPLFNGAKHQLQLDQPARLSPTMHSQFKYKA